MMHRTIAAAAEALRCGETTSVQLARDAIAQADRYDDELGIYLQRFDETMLLDAERADSERDAGRSRGALHGIPIGVKDIFATLEGPTTAQSRAQDPAWNRGRDATVVARLRSAGALIAGKTTTMEYAVGLPDPLKHFPLPRNPWNPEHWSGGSSSGSAIGVAVGTFAGAVGSDTGGSIRSPASSCGITGLKPTYGLVPKTGSIPLGFSSDHVGPMARSAEDCALLLEVMAGADVDDPTTAGSAAIRYSQLLKRDWSRVRIGVASMVGVGAIEDPGLGRMFDAACGELVALGADVVPVTLPYYDDLTAAKLIASSSEAFAYHRRALGEQWGEYGLSTRLTLAMGALTSAGDYVQAQRVRRMGQRLVAELFATVDFVVMPTGSSAAPRLDDLTGSEPLRSLFTPYWNALGNPAMTVPMGLSEPGVPLGLQIVGRPADDAGVLALGHAYQARTAWHLRELPHLPPPPPGAAAAPPRRAIGAGGEAAGEYQTITDLLRRSGIHPGPDEVAVLARAERQRRESIDRMYVLPDLASEEEPVLIADMVSAIAAARRQAAR